MQQAIRIKKKSSPKIEAVGDSEKFVAEKRKKRRKKASAYTRHRNRIMQQVRRIEKRTGKKIGFYIPTENQLRKQGVTGHKLASATAGLKHIHSKEIEAVYGGYSESFDPTTGEIFSNEENFEVPFVPSAENLFDRSTLEYFDNFVNSLPDRDGTRLLRKWKDEIVANFGTRAFVQMFDEANTYRPIAVEYQIYDGPVALDWISTALYYLPDSGPITVSEYQQAMSDTLREINNYMGSEEYYEEL